jgi:diacylglycerol kinase (ATP)
MRAVLIGNPNAGQKAGLATNEQTVDDAIVALREQGIEPAIWLTEGPGDATRLAQRAVDEGQDMVIAAGGDGTVQEVAQPLVGTDITLGVMPLGSVMNLARTLGIARDLKEAAQTIRDGRLLHMDVGEVNGRYFLEYGGVGIDAALYPFVHQFDSGEWGSLWTMIRIVFRYRPTKMTLSIDGQRDTFKALMVIVGNTPYFGPAVELSPEAKIDDRQFDIKVFDRFSRTELLWYGIAIARGRRPYSAKVRHLRGRTVAVSSSRPLPAHADIQPIGETPITFRLVPHALKVWANPALWEQPAAATPVVAAAR